MFQFAYGLISFELDEIIKKGIARVDFEIARHPLVRTGVSQAAIDRLMTSAPAGLVIDLNVGKYGRVVEITVLVKKGDIDIAHAVWLTTEEVMLDVRACDLSSTWLTTVTGETGVDPVCPNGSLITSSTRCVLHGNRQVCVGIGI